MLPPPSRQASWSFDAQLRELNAQAAWSAQQQMPQMQQMQQSFGGSYRFPARLIG